jgi:hypothetical protein
LPGSFSGVDARGNAEQALIGFGILDGGCCCPPLDRKHHRPLALLELPHEVVGATPERGQQAGVLGDIRRGYVLRLAPCEVLPD